MLEHNDREYSDERGSVWKMRVSDEPKVKEPGDACLGGHQGVRQVQRVRGEDERVEQDEVPGSGWGWSEMLVRVLLRVQFGEAGGVRA